MTSVSVKVPSGAKVRGEVGVAGERKLVGVPSLIPGVKVYPAINEYQLRLDVQRFLWPVYYRYIRLFIITLAAVKFIHSENCLLRIITESIHGF